MPTRTIPHKYGLRKEEKSWIFKEMAVPFCHVLTDTDQAAPPLGATQLMSYRQRAALNQILFCLALIAAVRDPRDAVRAFGRRLIAKRLRSQV